MNGLRIEGSAGSCPSRAVSPGAEGTGPEAEWQTSSQCDASGRERQSTVLGPDTTLHGSDTAVKDKRSHGG